MKKKPQKKTAAGSYLGLDLAKDKFDAALRAAGGELQHKVFANSAEGLKELGRWLSAQRTGKVRCVMEATGIYWEEVTAWLHARGHTVHVLNPAQARRFAESQLCRQKTDAVDAALLCRMAQIAVECEFHVWAPPAEEVLVLRRLSRGRAALVDHCASLRQQRLECREKAVKKALDAAIATVVVQIKRLVEAMKEHVAAHPSLSEEVALLKSIDGIAFVSAAAILGELAPLPEDTGARQAVAYAGLNPRQWQSGKSVQAQSRLSKTGNARLCKALYMPALTGWQCNPLLKAFAARLLAKGKKKMQVLGALMHKLLALCCGVLKTRQSFDASWLEPEQTSA